jgi:hypothetical protein
MNAIARIAAHPALAEAEILRLRAQIATQEAYALDAARYRWLREQMLGVDFDWCNGITALAFEMPDGCAYGGDCDQNIDAAIAAKKGAS